MMRRDRSNNDSSTDSARRAEEIRRRRATRGQDRASQASHRISNPAPARPVIVRGRNMDSTSEGFKSAFRNTPIYRQAGTRPRRQFYVAVDSAAGTELRLPAIPLINPGWRTISAILVILAAIAAFSLLNSTFFRVTIVEVEGLQRLNGADLQAVLRLENLSIIEIQPDQVKQTLAVSFPELADIQVEVSLPNAVKVTARERQPILAWKMGDNVRWIDAEGNVFPARGDAGPLVTINTEDEIPLAALTEDELAQVQAAATANPAAASTPVPGVAIVTAPGLPATGGIIRKADLALLNASLQLVQKLPEGAEIVYDDVKGLGWNDPRDWQVFIGKDLENFEEKFALYQAITDKISADGVQGVNLISVAQLNAPYYRAEHHLPGE